MMLNSFYAFFYNRVRNVLISVDYPQRQKYLNRGGINIRNMDINAPEKFLWFIKWRADKLSDLFRIHF